ncbi:MAG: nucleoside-diphosphate sugar epimerase [Xanthobacteraceae bacterium]|nr:nucleoside-diphosphate sugar epimerase [Xanthobacteraceae bacterium]
MLISLAVFWIGSGLASLGPGYAQGIGMMQQGGVDALAPLAVIGGGLADLLVGLGIAIRRTAGSALIAGIALALFYALAGTLLTPWLWLDPLAPLLKIAPVITLHLIALATLRDR